MEYGVFYYGAMEHIAIEYFALSLPRGSCQGPQGHCLHTSLTQNWEQAGELAHQWDPAQPPQKLKEGLGFGNREEEP